MLEVLTKSMTKDAVSGPTPRTRADAHQTAEKGHVEIPRL